MSRIQIALLTVVLAICALTSIATLMSALEYSSVFSSHAEAQASVERVYQDPGQRPHEEPTFRADLSWNLPSGKAVTKKFVWISPQAYEALKSSPSVAKIVYKPSAPESAPFLEMDRSWVRGRSNFQYFAAALMAILSWLIFRAARWMHLRA